MSILTQTHVRAELKKIGMTLSYKGYSNEYCVNFASMIGVTKRISDKTAYYTNNLLDALQTGRKMAAARDIAQSVALNVREALADRKAAEEMKPIAADAADCDTFNRHTSNTDQAKQSVSMMARNPSKQSVSKLDQTHSQVIANLIRNYQPNNSGIHHCDIVRLCDDCIEDLASKIYHIFYK